MEAGKDDVLQAIEPEFLSLAMKGGVRVRVGQMNRTEFEGTIREIGRYDINLDVNGQIVTLLKQEITYLSAPHPLLNIPPLQGDKNAATPSASAPARPNVQQEFLEKALKEDQPLTVFLINGSRIKANLDAYDSFTILLREGGRQHLYYKHAITTINR